MANSELTVKVLTPVKALLDTSARSVNAPGVLGYMGILPGHAAMVSELGKGILVTEQTSGTQLKFEVTGGYLEVVKNIVTIVVDQATPAK